MCELWYLRMLAFGIDLGPVCEFVRRDSEEDICPEIGSPIAVEQGFPSAYFAVDRRELSFYSSGA